MSTDQIEALKQLVARWRELDALIDQYDASLSAGWKSCANELEAVIDVAKTVTR